MSAILLGRDIVHYEVLGRGKPVIFLHGWVGSWRYWIPAMQAASVSFRTYALDQWGFGDTSKNQRFYSLEQQLWLVDAFMEQMGIVRAAFVGHGLGAVLALMVAQRHPQVVDRVLAVSYPTQPALIHPRLRSTQPVELVDWLLGRNGESEPVRADAPKSDPLALQISLNDLTNLRLAELCRLQPTACLLVSGEKDIAIQSPRWEQMGDLPEKTHLITFEQSGHFPMLDDSSKFNRLVTDFLGLPSGESPRVLQLKEEWKRRVR